jgi:glutamate--cysteine ligase
MLAIARAGLKQRRHLDAEGLDEGQFLTPLDEIVARQETQAERLLAQYKGWNGSITPLYEALSF